MAVHQGKDGLVYIGGQAVGLVTGWTYDDEVDFDTKQVKNADETYAASYKGGSGNISFLLDQEDAGQLLIENGDTPTLILYEGENTAGNYKYSGAVVIDNVDMDSPLTGHDTGSAHFVGILTEAVITP